MKTLFQILAAIVILTLLSPGIALGVICLAIVGIMLLITFGFFWALMIVCEVWHEWTCRRLIRKAQA